MSGSGSGVAEDHLRLAEALVFASAEPVQARQLAGLLPEDVDADDVLRAVQARYAGRGVELWEVAGGWQFRTAADLAGRLTRVIVRPRRLPRVAMETLAIVAWHQPVTRAQIEEIRGAALGQPTLDALLEAGLIRPAGHKEVPGRPTLWATTPQFLQQFGLRDLKELPRREELVTEQGVMPAPPDAEPPAPAAQHAVQQEPAVPDSRCRDTAAQDTAAPLQATNGAEADDGPEREKAMGSGELA